MGHQESFLYTNACDVEQNSKDIERILALFKKYNVRCTNDELAGCTHKLHFNDNLSGKGGWFEDEPMFFRKGMEMLVVCGERSAQRSIERLFDGDWYNQGEEFLSAWHQMTPEERKFASGIQIVFIENLRFVCEAEKTDKITLEELNVQPDKNSHGFYPVQQKFDGDMEAFLEAMDSIEGELPVNVCQDPGSFETAVVSVGSFLQGGYFGHLALHFADTHGFDICALRVDEDLLHVFNTFRSDSGDLCYLDARGITANADQFLEPFGADISCISGPYTRSEVVDLMKACGMEFVEDEISRAMVNWLVDSFTNNYDPSPLLRSPSLDEKIKMAKNKNAAQPSDEGKSQLVISQEH